MIYILFITTTQKTAIWELHPSYLEPIQSEHLPPSSLPSKKTDFSWYPIHPYSPCGKQCGTRFIQHPVSFFNPEKTISSLPPFDWVILQGRPMTPQSTEQITNHVQLPIIEVPHKNQIPISLARMMIPHLLNRSISMHGKDKKMVETLGQRSISAPTVFPEFDFGALPNQKSQIFPAPFRFFLNVVQIRSIKSHFLILPMKWSCWCFYFEACALNWRNFLVAFPPTFNSTKLPL